MARVLVDEKWYESVRSDSWNEPDYESLVLSHASRIFPEWVTVLFKANVEDRFGVVKRPDLALIDRQYRCWYVVEVEMSHHNLVGHVLPQIEVFASGIYTEAHADYLHGKDATLDRGRLGLMVKSEQPLVHVVVDRPDTNWAAKLRAFDVTLSSVEPFRDAQNNTLLRINGEQPRSPGNVVTRLTRNQLRRFWSVESPAALPAGINKDNPLKIVVDGAVTLWQVVEVGDGALIVTGERGDPLKGWRVVDLLRRDDGSFEIRKVIPERLVDR